MALPTADAPRSPLLLRVVLIVGLLALLFAGGRGLAARLPEFATYIDGLGAIGPLVFVVGYAIATVAFIPGSLLTFAAGAIFGLTKGVLLVFAGASVSSLLSFLIARYVAREAIARRFATNARFTALDNAIASQGRRIVFLLRLSPAFPFALLNYTLGLTKVSLRDYLLAGVGMLPGTLLYVYYGKLAGDVAFVAGGAAAPKDAAYYAVLALGLVATIVATTLVARLARSALRSATGGAGV